MSIRNSLLITTATVLLTACTNTEVKRMTLHSIDVSGAKKTTQGEHIVPKSDDDIRIAYENYLKHASRNDKSRINALTHLTEP